MTTFIERPESGTIEGYLKQQCVDASGLFVWEKKLFSLDIIHLELHIKEDGIISKGEASLSLKGVKYAKEWSFSSSVSGFGFDLVWFSGKLWSFFAEDEPMCKRWVASINHAISISKDSSKGNLSGNYENATYPVEYDHLREERPNNLLNNSSILNETRMEETSPLQHYSTPFSAPPTTDKFHSLDTGYHSAASRTQSRDTHSVHSRKLPPNRYDNTDTEHEYPPYAEYTGISVRSGIYTERDLVQGLPEDFRAQHNLQRNHSSSDSVAPSKQEVLQNSVAASSSESARSQQFSLHSQSLLSQAQSQAQSQHDQRSHHENSVPQNSAPRNALEHPSSASVRSHQSQQKSLSSAQLNHSGSPHQQNPLSHQDHSLPRSQDRDLQLPHYPTSASIQSAQRSVHEDLSSKAPGHVSFPSSSLDHTRQSAQRSENSVHGVPHYPTSVSVTSNDPSVRAELQSQAPGRLNFPASVASHSQEARSELHQEQNSVPHFPSGASVNTLHSYEQSLLRNDITGHAHDHINYPAGVASSSSHYDYSIYSATHETESVRPPVYPSSSSVISALTHDVSHHPKGLHAPSSGSRRGEHGDLASIQEEGETASTASAPSRNTRKSHQQTSTKGSENGDMPSVHSICASAAHSQHPESVHGTEAEHSDQESELHHRHYARVHPHGHAHNPTLPPSVSHSEASALYSGHERSIMGDEESSFGGSSNASRLCSFPAHESMVSSQQPSVSASAATHNIQQRLLFGRSSFVGPTASTWPGPSNPIGSTSARQSLEELPQSVQMSARMDIQRELSAHEVAKERPSVQAFAHEAQALHAKCQLLEMQLQRKESDVDVLKQRMAQLQDRFDQSSAEFEQRLDLARDRERQLISESKREMENKLLRASNDNMSFFDAANKSMRLQHERELSCLREELQEERKRHSNLLDRSQTLRERAERAEAETQQELTTLKDAHATLLVETARLKREFEIERTGFDNERKHLIHEAQSTITALQDEKEQVRVEAHQQLRDKMTAMNEKMQRSLNAIKDSDTEILRQELEGQHMRALAELHKKCQREIEIVRTEERKLAAIEMENIRTAFLSREHQTSEDLIQLETLHSARVKQLEQQVLTLKSSNTTLQEQLKVASKEAHYGSSQVQRAATEMQLRMEDHAARAEELQREVTAAHREIQEGKVREASCRDQLSRALTESRLYYAQLLEAKQQASTGDALAFQWRNATRESDASIAEADVKLQIAQDEIVMLEHRQKQLETENANLRSELQRADRLIYGANHVNSQQAISDAGSLNFNTTSLSTKHLLRSSLTSSIFASGRSDLMNPTVSSLAKNTKVRKALTPKR